MEKGRFYGVSVGPGDPELMTLKAVRVIREADVIAFPGREKEACTAYQIARSAVPEIEGKESLPIPMPMTKDKAQLAQSHRVGAERILCCLEEGKAVAFLTLGDVTIYSTGWYLYQLVREAGAEVKRQRRIPEAEQAGTSAAAGARDGGRRVTGTGYGLWLGSG